MSSIEDTKCPDCNGPMVPRTSKHGKFWGCKNYPVCKGTRDSMGLSKADRDKRKSESEEEEEPTPYRWDR